MTEPRILLFDVETAPNIGYTWGPKWDTNIIEFIDPWYLLCFGWKWHGEPGKAKVLGLDDYYDLADGRPFRPEHDKPLVGALASLFDEADIVVAHNCDKFDVPKLHARMWAHGMAPHSPVKSVDTLKLARKEFSFTSNKLDDICTALGLGQKIPTDFSLWKGCMAADAPSWRHMKRYCASDVDLLDGLYTRLVPWAPRHPNLATISERPSSCPRCGSEDGMVARGTKVQKKSSTAVSSRHQFQCKACGGYVLGRAIIKSEAKFVI